MILRGSASAGLLFLLRFSVASRNFFLFFFFIVLRKTTIFAASQKESFFPAKYPSLYYIEREKREREKPFSLKTKDCLGTSCKKEQFLGAKNPSQIPTNPSVLGRPKPQKCMENRMNLFKCAVMQGICEQTHKKAGHVYMYEQGFYPFSPVFNQLSHLRP